MFMFRNIIYWELVLEFQHEDFLDYELPEAECDALAGEKYCLLKLRKYL